MILNYISPAARHGPGKMQEMKWGKPSNFASLLLKVQGRYLPCEQGRRSSP